MLSKEQIEERVREQIETDEKLGDQAGESGHLSFVTYRINDILVKEIPGNGLEVSYSYTLIVETEFTIYPHNPPYEYPRQKKIVIAG